MFEKKRNDFSDFVEGEGYFENISSQNAIEIGDEISIVGGPGFGKSKAEPIHEELAPHQVDKDGNVYSAFVKTGVTVTNIVEEKDSYSMTFQTWKGHVEAGSINFTVFQGSDKNITMKISSIARNSNISTAFGYYYYYLGGKAGQTKIWTTFLKNFVKYSGGKENGIKY